jgi:hypothetical protein
MLAGVADEGVVIEAPCAAGHDVAFRLVQEMAPSADDAALPTRRFGQFEQWRRSDLYRDRSWRGAWRLSSFICATTS